MNSEDAKPGIPVANQGSQTTGRTSPEILGQVWRNTLTIGGGILAALALLFIVAFFAIEFASPQRSPYLGLFTFLVLPGFFVLGMIVAIVGLLRARRRFKRMAGNGRTFQYYPRIDLADTRHRRYLAVAAACTALTLPMIGVLSYEGYHYTDSNQFCGAVCHTVMNPQFTAYQHSPHAHVNCAECHIGAGASWYVKSKLSGIRQVLAVAINSYPRPIPPAIQELRPATETCRECHWPAKFFGDQLVAVDHFGSDEANTPSRIRMLLKTGGSDPSTGPPSGIHWHMALGFSIEYVATDKLLQQIPWVRITDGSTGRQAVYRSDGLSGTAPPPEGIHRTVDCMDCHNRPTHNFRSPDRAVDAALNVNIALQSLPFAKREMVAALSKPYASKSEGELGVANALGSYYQGEHPDLWQKRKADIDRLVLVAKEIYQSNFFPEMNVSWRTYPDNIGHKIFPGCFRCHEGLHKDDKGVTISHACGTCHEFMQPTNGDAAAGKIVGIGGFKHPIELEGLHATIRCDKCHTGGPAPANTCAGCHTGVAEFRAGTLAEFKPVGIPPDPMAASVECKDCHDLSKPRTVEAINEKCVDCHSDDEQRFQGMLAGWKAEADALLQAASKSTDPSVQKRLGVLRESGPLHNMEATRKILGGVARPTADQRKTPEPKPDPPPPTEP
jgi:nitrate/TMAO reductase-like tetraheme cytochrome c subunit